MEKTLALLKTDPEEDRRRAEERAQVGKEYLEMSPDLADIRKKRKPLTVVGTNGSNGGARKAKVVSSDGDVGAGGDGNSEETVAAIGGEDRDMVEEKRAEAEHTRIRRSSRQQQHRRQLNAGSNESEEGDQSIADLQHSKTTTAPIDDFSSTPDRESSSSSNEEGDSAKIEFEIRPRLIVYNMGMGPTKRKKRRFQALVEAGYIDQPLDFDFQKYPDFWRLGTETRGEYGWKAGIIEEVSLLDYYHDSLNNYSPGESNCNGAAMAFDIRNHTVRDGIMREWVQCARTKECVAPEGSSRANHRQDQAALTYLVKRMGYGEGLCHGMPEVFGIQVNQDRYCKEEIDAEPDRVVYT
ncbi:hypothetical protein BGW39_000847 [Mortierella sp. 14UC]|nr:hypothetical protein BGW39_000847 [Mortierella sp. 14UC]